MSACEYTLTDDVDMQTLRMEGTASITSNQTKEDPRVNH